MNNAINRFLIAAQIFGICNGAVAQRKLQINNVPYHIINDSTGIRALPFKFSVNKGPEKNNWRGKWIWLNNVAFQKYQRTNTLWIPDTSKEYTNYRALFRKKFQVNDLSSSAVLFISADVLFNVFVNNKLVGRGPVNIGSDYADNHSPDYWYYSSFNIKPYLKKGKNIIAVEVFATAFEISATTSSFGRLICDLSFGNRTPRVYTDSTWKCRLDTSFNTKGTLLTYNANYEHFDWKNEQYDDRQWPSASIVGEKKPKALYHSQIPVPLSFTLQPLRLLAISGSQTQLISREAFYKEQQGPREFVLDFGKNIPAYISFTVSANKDDSITVAPYEKIDYTSNRSFKYICRKGINIYKTPNLSVFRYLKIKIYVYEKMNISSFFADFSSYPVQYQGQFSCSNSFYNKLWDITRWTTQMCMSDMLFDSPLHQEPIGCTGDYFIESLNNYYAFNDSWLIRQNLIQTAHMLKKNNYIMFHTSYSLLWVQMLLKYYEYTGDQALVKQLLPQTDQLLQRFATYLDKDYLVDNAPNYMFMDWIRIDEFNAHHPPAVIGMGYLTMLYYKALRDAAELNEFSGKKMVSQKYNNLAQKIKEGINSRLWVNGKGLYKDGIPFITQIKPNAWLPADKDIVTYSPHVNTLAVLYDIAPKSRQDSLMKYVVTQTQYQLQPYFMSYVLAAFRHTQQIDEGLTQVDLWKNAIDTTTYTLKENWNDKTDDGYSGDYSHAWGGSPLLYLSQNILGVSPETPAFKTVKILPYSGDKISCAKGFVPLGRNVRLGVNWKAVDENNYIYQMSLPANYQAKLYHPLKLSRWQITINNKKIAYSVLPARLKSGDYTIKYHRK